MSAGSVSVELTIDTSRFADALRRAARATESFGATLRRVGRLTWRMNLTPGERHIDRVCKEILAGKPGRPAAIRLLAAADFAAVLDGKAGIR